MIHSPINGIVLDRKVEPGQTVATSFQAPLLFTRAEDLTQMELHVDVDEAEVGQVKARQAATFSVDAYPDRCFPARITQVRFGSQEVEGVITYETIGWVRKTDGKTTIEVDKHYQPALLGVEGLDTIWVLYWFDRNDTPEQRAILQVHPLGNPENPLRGLFATRAPVRPNLIALRRCRVISVQANIIEIDTIDAFPDTPVLDIKP